MRAAEAPTSGFRGFTLSLKVSQPADVNMLVDTAVDAGATTIKPVAKSFWGCGGVVQAPDGTIWKIATSAKKDPHSPTTVDTTIGDRGPLLIIGGGKDHQIPEVVTRQAYQLYAGSGAVTDYNVFEDRAHSQGRVQA